MKAGFKIGDFELTWLNGGTFELDAESTSPDAETDGKILTAHKQVFDAMR